jgi:hypothetical protein
MQTALDEGMVKLERQRIESKYSEGPKSPEGERTLSDSRPGPGPPLTAQSSQRTLADRPEIVFDSWTAMPDDHDVTHRVGQTGFHLANDGIAAHEISITEFEVEPGVRFRAEVINRIKENGDGFAIVWRKDYPGPDFNPAKWDLLGQMAAAAEKQPGSAIYRQDYSVKVTATYRDAFNKRYWSQAELVYIHSQNRLRFGPTTLGVSTFEKSTADQEELQSLARKTDQEGPSKAAANDEVRDFASGVDPARHPPAVESPDAAGREKRMPELNVALIKAWMDEESWTNKTLAQKLTISERAVSSMRNNGRYHGKDAVTKLANVMGREPIDLYLPPEAST